MERPVALGLGLLVALCFLGCATRVSLWPPSVEVAWGEARAGSGQIRRTTYLDAQNGSVTVVEECVGASCPEAKGGRVSDAFAGALGAARKGAGSVIKPLAKGLIAVAQ